MIWTTYEYEYDHDMGQIGMYTSKMLAAVLVRNRVSTLSILVLNKVLFLHSVLKLGMCFRRSYLFIIIDKNINKSLSQCL